MVEPTHPDLLEQFMAWAKQEPALLAVTVFGSRVRDNAARSDRWSDVDLHVITTEPRRFATREWTKIFGRELLAYAVRPASGGVTKATAVFRGGGEVDVVVVPAGRIRLARLLVSLGLHRQMAFLQRGLAEFATVMRGSHRVLKGGPGWTKFYADVCEGVRGTRLDDPEALMLAEEFVCDWLWVRQKLERGELVAAQRVLHRSLNEINIRLLHELRVRRGQVTYREARRVEILTSPQELAAVSVDARLEREFLRAATEKSGVEFRWLMGEMVGAAWTWPAGAE